MSISSRLPLLLLQDLSTTLAAPWTPKHYHKDPWGRRLAGSKDEPKCKLVWVRETLPVRRIRTLARICRQDPISMPRSALALTTAQAVKLGLAPLLRKEDFKQRGTTFYQITPESNQLILVQSGQWNNSSLSRFTIELGLYFPAMDAVTNQTWTKPGAEHWNPKIYNCQLRPNEMAP